MNEIIIYGTEWCLNCKRTKEFLVENHFSFKFISVDVSSEAVTLIESLNNGKKLLPILIIDNKSITNPSNHDLLKELGII